MNYVNPCLVLDETNMKITPTKNFCMNHIEQSINGYFIILLDFERKRQYFVNYKTMFKLALEEPSCVVKNPPHVMNNSTCECWMCKCVIPFNFAHFEYSVWYTNFEVRICWIFGLFLVRKTQTYGTEGILFPNIFDSLSVVGIIPC